MATLFIIFVVLLVLVLSIRIGLWWFVFRLLGFLLEAVLKAGSSVDDDDDGPRFGGGSFGGGGSSGDV